jgi:hypothetical protein
MNQERTYVSAAKVTFWPTLAEFWRPMKVELPMTPCIPA